ncbi:hypothetical protein ABT093_19830 [Kitasatospora sp. NPDC002551]|uniref:hypothetical protein n=1 Tax=Kitasatospora sp. NPDC002551 TaxID=3154539 RepID=UPI003316C39B
MNLDDTLFLWQVNVNEGRVSAADALIAAAPALRLQDGWQAGQESASASIAVAGTLDGGQVVALVTCPMHVSVMALGLSAASADRLVRAALDMETIDYPSPTGRVTGLGALDTSALGPGEHLAVSLSHLTDGRPGPIVKLYAHGVADVDLAQLTIPAAVRSLARLAAVPTTA